MLLAVHAEAIAKQSHALDALINGKMAEASKGQTEFSDVLEDTFICFCQFAYTGDYETPTFTYYPKLEESNALSFSTLLQLPLGVKETSISVLTPAEDVLEAPEWGITVLAEANEPSLLLKALYPSKGSILRQQFNDRTYNIQTIEAARRARCGIRENESLKEDYTPIFLGHARLYVFAEKWGIDSLKTLTLYKLHKTLTSFKIYEAQRGDVVKLVEFAYSNENTPDLDDGVDALKELVTYYVTCKLEILIGALKFLALLEQPRHFSCNLIRMMIKQIE